MQKNSNFLTKYREILLILNCWPTLWQLDYLNLRVEEETLEPHQCIKSSGAQSITCLSFEWSCDWESLLTDSWSWLYTEKSLTNFFQTRCDLTRRLQKLEIFVQIQNCCWFLARRHGFPNCICECVWFILFLNACGLCFEIGLAPLGVKSLKQRCGSKFYVMLLDIFKFLTSCRKFFSTQRWKQADFFI